MTNSQLTVAATVAYLPTAVSYASDVCRYPDAQLVKNISLLIIFQTPTIADAKRALRKWANRVFEELLRIALGRWKSPLIP